MFEDFIKVDKELTYAAGVLDKDFDITETEIETIRNIQSFGTIGFK